MNDKLVHLEFMKAAITGLCALNRKGLLSKTYYIPSVEKVIERTAEIADAALLEYQRRWEGEEKV